MLPPSDAIANAGKSPDVQRYLKEALRGDSLLRLIPFPYRKLMNIPYQNVFDKKYCAPVLKVVRADIVLMSHIEQVKGTGHMDTDLWNVKFRVYYPSTGKQRDLKVQFRARTLKEIREGIMNNKKTLVDEVIG